MGVKRSTRVLAEARKAIATVTKCAYCGRAGSPTSGPDRAFWHVDHVYPLSSGGLDGLANMVRACARCNQAKDVNRWRPIAGTSTAAGTLAEDEIRTYGPVLAKLDNLDKLKAKFPPGYRPANQTTFKEREQKRRPVVKPEPIFNDRKPRAKKNKKQWQPTHRHVHQGNVKLDERVGTYAWIYTSRNSKRVLVRFQDLTLLNQTTYMKTPVSYVHKKSEAPAKPIVDYREAGTYQVIKPRAK